MFSNKEHKNHNQFLHLEQHAPSIKTAAPTATLSIMYLIGLIVLFCARNMIRCNDFSLSDVFILTQSIPLFIP
jgi:hypothetical protein